MDTELEERFLISHEIRDGHSLHESVSFETSRSSDIRSFRMSDARFTRTRLVSRIAEAVAYGQNVVINAPSGFGKSSLVADFIDRSDFLSAWIDFRSVSSVSTLWDQVFRSFGIDAAKVELTNDGEDGEFSKEIEILVDYLSHQRMTHILVLDSCSSPGTSEKTRILEVLRSHCFVNLSVIFIYGAGSYWRELCSIVHGETLYLGAKDFALSPDEFASMIEAFNLDKLPCSALDFIREQIDGWPVGLKLLSLSGETGIRHFSDVQGFDAFPSWRFGIARYVEQEILPVFPVEEQEFLLRTSILPVVTPGICSLVSKWDFAEAQHFLSELGERGFLLYSNNSPDNEGLNLPRYQKLLAAGLRLMLEERQPGAVEEIVCEAVEYYEKNGNLLAAARLASRFGRLDLFVGIIDAHYEEIISSGWAQGFADIIGRFPPSDVFRYPQLSLIKAWVCISLGHYGEAEHLMDVVEASILHSDPKSGRSIRDDLFSARLMLEVLNYDANGIMRLIMMYNLNFSDDCSLDHSFLCGLVNLSLGLSGAITGGLAEAKESLIAAYGASDSVLIKYLSVFFLSEIALKRGELTEATRCLNDALDIAQDTNAAKAPFASLAYIRLAGTYYEQNLLDEAQRCLKRGMRLGKSWWVPDVMCSGYSTIGHIQSATGSPVDLSLSYKAEERERTGKLRRIHKPFFMHYSYQKLKASVGAGNQDESVKKAKALYDLYQQGFMQINAASLHEFLWMGSMMYATGGLKEAIDICDGLVSVAEDNEYITELLDILILRAMAQQARRNNGEATADIVKAVDYAEPRGYFRTFVDEGSAILPLLRRAMIVSSKAEYIQRLIDAIREQEPVFNDKGDLEPQILSRREVQVLKLAYTGLVNKEIASLLGLSNETIKSYFKSINVKLGVSNKMEAIRKASDMGLIEDDD